MIVTASAYVIQVLLICVTSSFLRTYQFGVVVTDALKHLQRFLPTMCANSHNTYTYKFPTYFFAFRACPVAKKVQPEKDLLQPGSTSCLFPVPSPCARLVCSVQGLQAAPVVR